MMVRLIFYFDLKCTSRMKLSKLPFFLSTNDGLDLCLDATNIPASLVLEANLIYNVAVTLNRTVVGIMRNVFVFQFDEFSLCRYLAFQVHEKNSTIHLSQNAILPKPSAFPDLASSNRQKIIVKTKEMPFVAKKIMPKIKSSGRILKGVKPPM